MKFVGMHATADLFPPTVSRITYAIRHRMSGGEDDLRAQQVLQDVLVVDGGRSVVLAVLLDLLVRVLLAEERHLGERSRAYSPTSRTYRSANEGPVCLFARAVRLFSLNDARNNDVRRCTTH